MRSAWSHSLSSSARAPTLPGMTVSTRIGGRMSRTKAILIYAGFDHPVSPEVEAS